MTHSIKIYLLIIGLCISLILTAIVEPDRCPEQLHNKCRCSFCPDGKSIMVECVATDTDEFNSALKSINCRKLCTFSLSNTSILDINRKIIGNYFKASTINLYNIELNNFDLFNAFHSMEDILFELRLRNVSAWHLNVNDSVYNFKQFRNFHLSYCSEIPYYETVKVNSVIPILPKHLGTISINKCKVTSFEDNFFARFAKLRKLDLSYNELKYVNRRSLGRPANRLFSYNLSFNPINYLPDDMFEDMPALKIVSLQGTYLSTLPYHVFKPVVEQLTSLKIMGIPLNCDCEASWLLKNLKLLTEKWKTKNVVKCNNPHSLWNHPLESLIPMDMCMNCEVILQSHRTYNKDTTWTSSYATENTYDETIESTKELPRF